MPSIFAYQSSEVDWCESNFQHSELVAEHYNTFSNVTFFIFGPLMMFLMHPYAQKRSRYIYGICLLFMVIGMFSAYFHMTLSFLGQLLDEISILWLLAGGYGIWLPRCYFPAFLGGNRAQFTCLVTITTIFSTFLSFLRPTVNAYALNSIAVHILYIVFLEYKKWVLPAGAGMVAPYPTGPPCSSGMGVWLTPRSRPPANEERGQAWNLRLFDAELVRFY